MQKIILQNFGPIQNAEIAIKPITVLLGEQATGKSTVAQCVHLFLSLREDFVRDIRNISPYSKRSFIKSAVENIVRSKFYAYYGSSKYLEKFDIKFYFDFDSNKFIHIRPIDNINRVDFSEAFELDSFCDDILEALKAGDGSLSKKDFLVRGVVDSFFDIKDSSTDSLPKYFIAGRNITTSYSEVFNAFFAQNFRQITRLGSKNIPRSAQMELTSDFILHSAEMKDKLLAYGGILESLFEENQTRTSYKTDFLNRANDLLKGKYYVSSGGDEKIRIRSGKHIPLHLSSSGQQESIRIIQDLALLSATVDKTHRTIEEPEAHLFPSAQNALTELIVMTHNHTESSFFLTTHSPYFLASFNNLLYAAKAVNSISDIELEKLVTQIGYPKHLRLDSSHFTAYQLKNGSAESIYDPEEAIMDINGLDAVSEEIATKFDYLIDIIQELENAE